MRPFPLTQAKGCDDLAEAREMIEADGCLSVVLINLHHDTHPSDMYNNSQQQAQASSSQQGLSSTAAEDPNNSEATSSSTDLAALQTPTALRIKPLRIAGEPWGGVGSDDLVERDEESPSDNGSADGGGSVTDQTARYRGEYRAILEMKRNAAFRGVQVIALSPFKLHSFNFLPTGVANEAPESLANEFKGWQVVTKPITAAHLLGAVVGALRDDGCTTLPRGRSLSMAQSLRYTPLGALARHPRVTTKPVRVLLVDDMPVKLKLVEWIIESCGMQATCAMDGFECVETYSQSDFDLILMDVKMPHLNGHDATSRIREIEKEWGVRAMHMYTPIIGISCAKPGDTDAISLPKTMGKSKADAKAVAAGRPACNELSSDEEGGNESDGSSKPDGSFDDCVGFPIDQKEVIHKCRKWAAWTRSEQMPVIGLDLLFEASGNVFEMVRMVDEFVRTAYLQLGSLRNAFLLSEPRALQSSCEVIKTAARRFGAVWLLRAASHLAELLVPSKLQRMNEEKVHELRVDALAQCEEEIKIIKAAGVRMRAHLEMPACPDGGTYTSIMINSTTNSDPTMMNAPSAANTSFTTNAPSTAPPPSAAAAAMAPTEGTTTAKSMPPRRAFLPPHVLDECGIGNAGGAGSSSDGAFTPTADAAGPSSSSGGDGMEGSDSHTPSQLALQTEQMMSAIDPNADVTLLFE